MRGTVCIADAVNWDSDLNKDGLVSWWLALPDQQRGNVFRDICMRNHGTLTSGPTWQGPVGRPGEFGSLNFASASSQYVVDSANPTKWPTGAASRTISFWKFERTRVDGVNSAIAEFTSAGSTFTMQCALIGGTVYLATDSVTNNIVVDTIAPQVGVWEHMAYVYDGSQAAVYINGTVVQQRPLNNTGTITAFQMGRRSGAATGYFDGLVDDVRVHDRVLSTAEITAIYQDSRRGYQNTLNWIRSPVVFDMVGGAPPASSILLQMMQHYYQGAA
jgi:hypothetical protein